MNDDHFKWLRNLGAKYWQFIISAVTGIITFLKVFYDVSKSSASTQTWFAIIVGLSVLIVIRFPRIAIRLTRAILPPPPLPPNPPRIFRGPLPYLEGDTLPERQAENEDCWRLIQGQPFFILEGESGCGKSSILNAALIPKARSKFRIIECRVAYDPMGKLLSALRREPYRQSEQPIDPKALAEAITSANALYSDRLGTQDTTKPILLCIDQFEELFVTVRDEVRNQFLSILKNAIEHGELRMMIGIRNDFRDLLMSLCRAVDPTQQVLNLGVYYPLQVFSQSRAIAVLGEMLNPIHAGDPLREQELNDFAKRLVQELLLPPRDKRLCQDDQKNVLPVELQIVGMMIESVGNENLSIEGLRRLGGKVGLLRTYVEEAKEYVWRKTGLPSDQALLVLRQLISPARTKWSRTPESIAKDLGNPSAQVESVLQAFADKFLVRRLPDETGENEGQEEQDTGVSRYELMHEHLVRILIDAPQPILQKARDAEERLQFWERRTKEIFLSEEANKTDLSAWLRKVFAQPIPLIESLRLWQFATSKDYKQMLRRNLKGFSLKLASVFLPLILISFIWYLRINSDSYQIRSIVPKAPLDQLAASPQGSSAVIAWAKALIYVDRANDAFTAIRRIKNGYDKSKAFAIAAVELTKADSIDKAKEALYEALSIEEFSWDKLHSDAVAAVTEGMAKTNNYAQISNVIHDMQDKGNRSRALAAASEGLVRAGKNEQAIRAFDEALATTNYISDAETQAQILISAAQGSIKGNTINDAKKALGFALVAARNIGLEQGKFEALLNVAQNYAILSEIGNATKALNEAFAANPSGWRSDSTDKIADIAEAMARAGKAQDALIAARGARMTNYKHDLFTGIVRGLFRAGNENEALLAIEEIKDHVEKVNVLCVAATELIQANRINAAKRPLEAALVIRPQLTARYDFFNMREKAYENLIFGLLKIGESDRAIEIVLSLKGASLPEMVSGRQALLTRVTIALAKTEADKAYITSGSIKDKVEASCALAAVVVAMIKSGQMDKAKKVQAEVLAARNELNDGSSVSGFLGRRGPAQVDNALVGIATAFAEAGKIDEAQDMAHQIKEPDNKYRALESMAKELLKQDRFDEALNIVDESNRVLQSSSLANLALWLSNAHKSEKIQAILPLIEYGDDKSRANAALAKWQARSGSLRVARETADSCSSPSDQLGAYITILIEYAKRQDPSFATRFGITEPSNENDQNE